MDLCEADAIYAAQKFIDYFSDKGRIDEYLRNVKLDRISQQTPSLPGFGPEDDMFSDFDIHPQDMNFKVYAAGESVVLVMSFSMKDFRLQLLTQSNLQFLVSH